MVFDFEVSQQHNEHAALITSTNFVGDRQFMIVECEEETLVVMVKYWQSEQIADFRFS